MNRSWPIWLILIVCALSILGALGWQTQRTLSMERERLEANARAKVEERVRLALSRMDTVASAMLVIENQRPPEYYQAFYQPQVLFTNTLQSVDGKLVTQPSPLLSEPPEFIQLHFEVWAGRDLTSPQVPIGNHRDLAEASGVTSEKIETSTRRLRELHILLNQPATIGDFGAGPAPGENELQQEVNLNGAALDNYTLMCQAVHGEVPSWSVAPTDMPQMTQGWSNTQLNELVSNAYNKPQEQSAYQQDLNATDRYKRQQVYDAVQYKASKKAVQGKSVAKSDDLGGSQDEPEVEDDAKPQGKAKSGKTRRLLVNPSTSVSLSLDLSALDKKQAEAPGQKVLIDGVAEVMRLVGIKKDSRGLQDTQAVLIDPLQRESEEDADAILGTGLDIVDIDVTPFRPLWLNDELMVVRQVRAENGMRFQGFWLDADAMSQSLLEGVSDLLPNAKLIPIAKHQTKSLEQVFEIEGAAINDRSLVTLPWKLEEGIEVDVTLAGFTPLHTSLGIGWFAVILAMIAAAMLVRGVLRMSERRAAFVSSVTHELRTPLTTFQLYSDLLAEGMVPEGEKRQSYLKTMRLEAGRLNHLIENVLSYSRIERGSARAQREKLSVASLVGRFESRLGSRAQRDHARLEVNGLTDFGSAEVDTDFTAVEQIIFNLVDNACKYGLPEDGEGVIRLNLSADRKWVRLSICDSGKGIRRGDHRKLFKPFHKSAHDAAETKPGVGLGLALCRRLARALGGNLTVDSKRDKGACFELKLPRV